MVAVLEFVDGFGHDTEVVGIYPTLEIAKSKFSHNFLYQEFDFGKVCFDLYDAKEAYPQVKKKRKRKIEKPLDKFKTTCYNIDIENERN